MAEDGINLALESQHRGKNCEAAEITIFASTGNRENKRKQLVAEHRPQALSALLGEEKADATKRPPFLFVPEIYWSYMRKSSEIRTCGNIRKTAFSNKFVLIEKISDLSW